MEVTVMFPKRLLAIGLVAAAILAQAGLASAQWMQTNGPEGGKPGVFFSFGSNIFVGTEGAGIFRSSDSGATWH
ncbi:MAG: hypothetical protein ACHQNE_05885, partial [Candidatus Kapaibacterium sp.]